MLDIIYGSHFEYILISLYITFIENFYKGTPQKFSMIAQIFNSIKKFKYKIYIFHLRKLHTVNSNLK